MKILLYSHVFFPMVGGMETVTECMAELFIKAGHECVVITPVKDFSEKAFPFLLYRNPNIVKKIQLVLWADIIYSNGASLALLPLAKLLNKPFIWTHTGYQASCIDGLGWANEKPAPTTPWKSIKFHFKTSGFLYATSGSIKLILRRFAAQYLVDRNVAITHWMNSKQPLNRQIVIYNPTPIYRFLKPSESIKEEYDFVYVGRLVSEKGVSTLLKAFQILLKNPSENKFKLLIVGDGDYRENLESLAMELEIASYVDFVGKKSGQELTDFIHSARIAVVPSDWEEPMGIVAVELMVAGRNIIVSEFGGLTECIGAAGLTFPNYDYKALAESMFKLYNNAELAQSQKSIAARQIKKFDPVEKVNEYILLFKQVIKGP